MDLSALRTRLTSIGQQQVLRFFDQLPPAGQQKLLAQLNSLDLDLIARLAVMYVRNKPPVHLPRDIRPIDAYPRTPDPARARLYADAASRGEQLLREGKVGAFLVAGGQGTRLGFEGPKGEYPVTPIRNKPLFQVFAEQLLNHSRACGRPIPWYIMTSDINDAATREFFRRHGFFGYDPAEVLFFQQGMMPAFALDGSLLLAGKDSLALSPDGHGGSLRALERSGALADMKQRGIEHLSYFQVDNPLVHTMDPLFLGLHELTGSEMSSKTIAKAGPLEKVGNFCIADGALQVIEYSDLPDELAVQRNPDGSLMFNAGSIAIHALRTSFVQRLNAGGELQLPWHRAEKKVEHLDDAGNLVRPDQPNAVKLEQFVFDAIPLAQNPIVYTTDRGEEFSPVKNADGPDSPATSRRDQVRRWARWLREAGVDVPTRPDGEVDAIIEISPLLATSARQLKTHPLPKSVAAGEMLYLE
jgi:UDP-N-acetylglucosamine/UDP-N-acetylgalactosamine diphosphorylase